MAKSKSNKNEEKSQIDAVAMEPPKDKFLIVGLGASAGGIQAFHEFFQHVPSKSGIAYVVILHLSPDHDSNLAHVLQQVTKIPVTQVNEKVKVQTDHVY